MAHTNGCLNNYSWLSSDAQWVDIAYFVFNKCFTQPATLPFRGCCRHLFHFLCTPPLQWQNGSFSQHSKTTDNRHHRMHYNGNGPGEDAFQMHHLIPDAPFSTTTKRDPEKKKVFVDTTPAADGNKRRLKLVAFCIAKPKLHLRSTLPIIVFQ